MLEDTLFGHEPGAFTGATGQRRGKIALANTGTIFLDEIGEIPLLLQSKLLRFLETKTYSKVGGDKDCKVDVRILAATNRDLKLAIDQKLFREDLYYRLNLFPITLPPIRARRGDIKQYVKHFLQDLTHSSPTPEYIITNDAMKLLEAYSWPGNIREIFNVIERAKILSSSATIDIDQLPIEIRNPDNHNVMFTLPLVDLKTAVQQTKELAIKAALKQTEGNQTQAAKILGTSRLQLHRMMKAIRPFADRNKTTSA